MAAQPSSIHSIESLKELSLTASFSCGSISGAKAQLIWTADVSPFLFAFLNKAILTALSCYFCAGAEHYNSDTGGRFTHYIIWNEVANGDWFDASPTMDNKREISQQDTNLWLDT